MQLIITIVFFDSLWLKTNKGLVNSLSNEISTFINLYQKEESEKKKEVLLKLFQENKPYNISISKGKINRIEDYSKFAFYDRLLKQQFKKNLNYKFWFNKNP